MWWGWVRASILQFVGCICWGRPQGGKSNHFLSLVVGTSFGFSISQKDTLEAVCIRVMQPQHSLLTRHTVCLYCFTNSQASLRLLGSCACLILVYARLNTSGEGAVTCQSLVLDDWGTYLVQTCFGIKKTVQKLRSKVVTTLHQSISTGVLFSIVLNGSWRQVHCILGAISCPPTPTETGA